MYKYFIIIAIFLGSLFSMETVAIIDLEGIGVSANDAKALTQRLTSQMIQIGKYTIVERSEMKRLLDEQKFQYSGCVDVACAVEIGKMLGAKTMVVGSVSKVGTVYSVDARMIDVKSAENYISADYTTTEDIGDLLIEGMKSIAYQLCERKYTKSNINKKEQSVSLSTSYFSNASERYIFFNGNPSLDKIEIYIDGVKRRLSYKIHLGILSENKNMIDVNPGEHIIEIQATDYKNYTDTIFVDASEDYMYEYNLKPKTYIKLIGDNRKISASIYGEKIYDKKEIEPGDYPIIIKPIDRNYEEIEDSITVKEGETAYYNIVLKKKKGKPKTYIKLIGDNRKISASIYGEKIYDKKEIEPGDYPIIIKPIDRNYEEIEDSITVKEGETAYYNIVLKKKKGKVSLNVEPPMADVKIGRSAFNNNSLYDYGKYVYKVSHPYYYPQTSSFNLSSPTYEENIILKSGKKDFRKLRNRKKKARIASIVSLLGLGISYYLHEDAYDKYNSATTPEDATKYRGLFNNTYNVQMAFSGLSAVSVLYTINLENKFSKLKKALSIKSPKKKKNPKQKNKQKQKQNKNRKRKQ